jgi:hypothetical protein
MKSVQFLTPAKSVQCTAAYPSARLSPQCLLSNLLQALAQRADLLLSGVFVARQAA